MKKVSHNRITRHAPGVPRFMHVMELVIGIVIVAGGQGLMGMLVSANPDITPPSTPANVVLTGRSATDIDISWDAATDDVGVVGYHVYRNGTQVGSPTTTTYSDTGLAPNTGYTYTISAYDAQANASSQSAPLATATLTDTAAPSTATNVRQTSSTTSSISVAWNASSDNVGVANYEVYRNGSLVRTQTGTTFTDTGLAVYTTYTYNIVARDAAGNASNLSAPLYGGTAPDVTAPSVPDTLRKTSSTVSSITIAWNTATDDIGVVGYHIYRGGSLIGTTAGTTYTDTGLIVSNSYTYTITAYDGANNESAQSQPFSTVSSDDTTAPTIPSNVRTTSVMDTSVAIAWNAATDDVAVTGYKVYRDAVLLGTTSSLNYTYTGLTPVTDYVFTIKAYDAANNTSAASSGLSVQTAYDTTAPSVPANLAVSARTDTSISLSWDASTDNVSVSGYDLYRNGALVTTTATTAFTDTGLNVDADYTYRVRAHDAYANNSVQSTAVVTKTLTDQIAPANPSNLQVIGQSTTTANLTWNAAADDVAVTGYRLFRDGVFIASMSGTSYNDSLLMYNKQYSYRVTAVDGAGNESVVSPALLVTTDPDVTSPTVTVTAPNNSASNVQYTIPVSAIASDDLDLKRVEFYADTKLIASITSAPFAFNWDTYAVANGSRQITAKAIDGAGNTTSQSVTISINNPPPALRGDLNGDHKVNIYDLSLLLSHYNKPGAGDFNNNGRVDIFDLSVLLGQYGKDNNYR